MKISELVIDKYKLRIPPTVFYDLLADIREAEEEQESKTGMIDEIFKVMKHFEGSYINSCGELILSNIGNVYFTATNCDTKEDVICKLLEWCSRPIAKGVPYATMKRNIKWRNSLLCGYNKYLETNFTQDDMYWIYDKLGNAVNHELTLEFIHSNYDLSLVRPQKSEDK